MAELAFCYPILGMMSIDDIRHQNLSALVEIFGGQRTLGDATGKNPAQISQWINRSPDSKTGKPRVVGGRSAREIEHILGLQAGWMDVTHSPQELESAEQRLVEKISSASFVATPSDSLKRVRDLAHRRVVHRELTRLSRAQQDAGSSAEISRGYVRLELLDGAAEMGDGAENTDFPEVIREMEFSEVQLRNLMGFLPRSGRLRLMTGRGISMEPLIRSGDVVIVDTGCQRFEGDGVYVINTGRGTQIKALQDRGDSLYVVSANSELFPAFKAPEETVIGGKVYLRNRIERLD